MARKLKKKSKHDVLHELLGSLGLGIITVAQYHASMKGNGFTEADVDEFLKAHYAAYQNKRRRLAR